MHELQVLGDEVDIDQAACDMLQIPEIVLAPSCADRETFDGWRVVANDVPPSAIAGGPAVCPEASVAPGLVPTTPAA